jgi:hypothetical protein
MTPKIKEKHLSMFSWRTAHIKPQNGDGGKYISLFGANRITVDNLPGGRTILNVNSIFGLTEIVVSKGVFRHAGCLQTRKVSSDTQACLALFGRERPR